MYIQINNPHWKCICLSGEFSARQALSKVVKTKNLDTGKTFLDSKYVLKVYFKSSRKNQDFFTTLLWACLAENSSLKKLPLLRFVHLKYICMNILVGICEKKMEKILEKL